MKVVAGCIIKKDNKILMIKENKSEFHGKWNYPAGKVEEFEKITEAAMRETFEETGCKVKLKGVLPIVNVDLGTETHVIIHFLAEMVEECNSFDKEEIKNLAFSELYTKAQSIIRTLSSCEVGRKNNDIRTISRFIICCI